MASSTGSSRGFSRPFPESRPGRRLRLCGLLALGAFLAVRGAAALPDYLREALDKFSAEVPAGWAYTQTTVRGDESTVERFDPARPPAEQWVLQLHNGRPPADDDLAKYARFKSASAPPLVQAPFQKTDIDPGSFVLVREDAERADFSAAFRTESTGSDKMLGHLRLLLSVYKQPAYIENFTLELRAPYSPVLGVKMNELCVRMIFAPPRPDRPSLPAASTSLFGGRIFFVPARENLQVTYTDFSRVEPPE